MYTKGKWIVVHDQFGTFDVEYRIKDGGGLICVCGTDKESEDNAKLIAAAPELLETCKELAEIFPEHSMSELDAADFKDRATRIWVASQSAKNIITKAAIKQAKAE